MQRGKELIIGLSTIYIHTLANAICFAGKYSLMQRQSMKNIRMNILMSLEHAREKEIVL